MKIDDFIIRVVGTKTLFLTLMCCLKNVFIKTTFKLLTIIIIISNIEQFLLILIPIEDNNRTFSTNVPTLLLLLL